ncbi:unnamed protein product [Rhodiola kirilowii]
MTIFRTRVCRSPLPLITLVKVWFKECRGVGMDISMW